MIYGYDQTDQARTELNAVSDYKRDDAAITFWLGRVGLVRVRRVAWVGRRRRGYRFRRVLGAQVLDGSWSDTRRSSGLASRVWKALGEDCGEVRRTAPLGDKRLDDAADQRVRQHCDRVVGKGET